MSRSLARSLLVGLSAIALLGMPSRAMAQLKPFPQRGGYGRGFVPGSITTDTVLSSYRSWKARYLQSDCGDGTYRVDFDSPPGSSVSEGMGYGMVLAAYFGDRAAFDGLWKFVRKNLNRNGLMGWKVTCSGFVEPGGGAGSATDGDTDIGFGLVAAIDQWGDSYKQPALDYLSTLKKVDYVTCPPSGRNLAKAGDWGGGCDRSNTSYWMPAYMRVFAELTGDAFWSKAADDAVALWLANRNAKTGLIANEVDPSGATAPGQGHVDYNGCRVPWRASLDYLWYGTPGAKDVTDRMTDWAGSVGISNLVDGYETNGKPSANARNTQLNAWVGGWACGAMSRSQEAVDTFADDFRRISDDNGAYYGASLRTLYLLVLSGNFWKPGTPPTKAAVAAVVDAGTNPPGVPPDPRHSTAPLAPPAAPSACGCLVAGAASSGPGSAFLAGLLTVGVAWRRGKTRGAG
jgi:endo-1,4-beta-D-glucanase Y